MDLGLHIHRQWWMEVYVEYLITNFLASSYQPHRLPPSHTYDLNVERCVQSGDDWYLRLDIISPVVYTSLSSLSTGE